MGALNDAADPRGTNGNGVPAVPLVPWSCPACTFLNDASRDTCQICTNKNPNSISASSASGIHPPMLASNAPDPPSLMDGDDSRYVLCAVFGVLCALCGVWYGGFMVHCSWCVVCGVWFMFSCTSNLQVLE